MLTSLARRVSSALMLVIVSGLFCNVEAAPRKGSAATFASRAFNRSRNFARLWRRQTLRTPEGETNRPCFLSSLLTRT